MVSTLRRQNLVLYVAADCPATLLPITCGNRDRENMNT